MKIRPDVREFLKKEAKSGLKVLLLFPVVAVAVWVFWFSPALINSVRTWTRTYNACVADARPAVTLGHVWMTRKRCAREARLEVGR